MAVQIFKPNIEVLRQQATQAREYEKKKKTQGQFRWGDLSEGENVLRLLPPTNSRGILGHKIVKHFTNRSPFKQAVPSHLCLARTFPEREGVVCPTCDAGDKLMAQFPQLDLRGWHTPGINFFYQAVDQKKPETSNVAQIYRFTPASHNWILQEADSLVQNGIDLTDIAGGIDIKLTITTTQVFQNGKSRNNTKYERTLWSPRGPTPLNNDQAVVTEILESMINIAKIWPYPDDAKLADFHQYGAQIYSHYKSMIANGQSQAQVPANFVSPPPPAQQPPQPENPPPPGQYAQPPQQVAQQIPVQPQVQQVQQPIQQVPQPQVQQVQQPIQQVPQPQVIQQPPVQQVVEQVPAPIVQAVPPPQQPVQQSLPVVNQPSPTDKPPCFGGENPRSMHPQHANVTDDGSTGYSEDSELCLTCKHELSCMDAG